MLSVDKFSELMLYLVNLCLEKVSSLVQFLQLKVRSVFLCWVLSLQLRIDDYAKDGGKELFTKMHCVLITNS